MYAAVEFYRWCLAFVQREIFQGSEVFTLSFGGRICKKTRRFFFGCATNTKFSETHCHALKLQL